ncbi:MAG: pyridine nucleotide-disulfide oxidoreductase, partial [Gammaproteobacteria bacterium CG12_big_fil_rev_8_21_14_0_65_46_12]
MTLARFSQLNFSEYLKRDTLDTLDQHFLSLLASQQKNLHRDLLRYRENPKTFSSLQISELIIHAARELENFIAEFFDIESATAAQQTFIEKDKAIFAFKKWIVLRRAKRRLTREETLEPFESLNAWLNNQLDESGDKELAVSELAVRYLDDKEAYEAKLEKLTQWAIHCLKDHSKHVSGWVSFKLPKRTDYRRLIPIITEHGAQQLPAEQWRSRDGFDLTDSGMNERQVQAEIDYCVLCHDHDGDFCSKGFPEKKGEPELGFRKNPLDNTLTGCPLDEKISEMNTLQKEGLSIAALATIMIDNPMCPATGHRICNDCMKACIYQKQDPVDVPQIETRILKDVLSLPYGVEIYDLLTRWNPLRSEQFVEKPYNGKKVFIAGMGPAGFSLAYHLLMEGCAVVGSDGLKIEDLPQTYLNTAIEHYSDITEPLSTRQVLGFGGVAEYGITVRWDKNFLKLIYISLSRRKHFQLFDGVRFGGTVTIESLYAMGFDHVSIAVGAGLPKALPIPGSMAPGMRQANDFLMALQLTGAAKKDSLANVQLRLPAVIIGGGLTGVDAATEAQAYYIKQVEKTLARYEAL